MLTRSNFPPSDDVAGDAAHRYAYYALPHRAKQRTRQKRAHRADHRLAYLAPRQRPGTSPRSSSYGTSSRSRVQASTPSRMALRRLLHAAGHTDACDPQRSARLLPPHAAPPPPLRPANQMSETGPPSRRPAPAPHPPPRMGAGTHSPARRTPSFPHPACGPRPAGGRGHTRVLLHICHSEHVHLEVDRTNTTHWRSNPIQETVYAGDLDAASTRVCTAPAGFKTAGQSVLFAPFLPLFQEMAAAGAEPGAEAEDPPAALSLRRVCFRGGGARHRGGGAHVRGCRAWDKTDGAFGEDTAPPVQLSRIIAGTWGVMRPASRRGEYLDPEAPHSLSRTHARNSSPFGHARRERVSRFAFRISGVVCRVSCRTNLGGCVRESLSALPCAPRAPFEGDEDDRSVEHPVKRPVESQIQGCGALHANLCVLLCASYPPVDGSPPSPCAPHARRAMPSKQAVSLLPTSSAILDHDGVGVGVALVTLFETRDKTQSSGSTSRDSNSNDAAPSYYQRVHG
ncbi:hypothetical protein B0H11DRAFT_1931291 [Mycena galericulata]|nr:hypothetical protein B0H11DRAFT_1931291 [Mycena galericulata]